MRGVGSSTIFYAVKRHLAERVLAEVRQSRARTQWSRAATWCDALLAIDPLNEEATLTLAEGKALLGSKAEAVALLDRYLAAIEAGPGELAIQPTLLRRRISERMPTWPADRSGWKVLVGRDALLESLAAHMRRAREGTGTIVSIWGEPGIGKTRLLRELNALGGVDGWSLATVSCEPSWPDRPLCALEVMVSTLLLQPGALGVDPKAHRALLQLTRIDPDDRGMPLGAEDTAYRQRLLRSSLLDLIDAVAAERPLLIAIDDAQWIDPSSLPFLSMAVEHAATRRVAFVFVAQQRDDLPKMASGARALVARVPALTSEESERLMATLVHGQPPSDRPELLRRAAAVSNGNPLYLHTLATHWLSTGDTSELPPSLEALIEQRLDTLAPPVLRCLQLCALLARHATVGRVEAVLQAERAVLLGALDDLHQAGLLETVGDAPLVRHGLIGKRAVGRASGSTVVLLHRYIAAELEPAAREGLNASLVLACAEHWRDAKEEKRGEELIEQTVRRLVRTGSIDAAWAVIKELEEAADAEANNYEVLAAKLAIGLCFATGDRLEAARRARQLIEETPGLATNQQPILLAKCALIWAENLAQSQSQRLLDLSISVAQQAVAGSETQGIALCHAIMISDQNLSFATLRRLTSVVDGADQRRLDLTDGWDRAITFAAFYSRRTEEAVQRAEARAQVARESENPYLAFVALHDLGGILRSSGRLTEAAARYREAVEIAEIESLAFYQTRGLCSLINCCLDLGHTDKAAPLRERLVAAAARVPEPQRDSAPAIALVRLALASTIEPLDETDPQFRRAIIDPPPKNPRTAAHAFACVFAVRERRMLGSSGVSITRPLVVLASRLRRWQGADFVLAQAIRALESSGYRLSRKEHMRRIMADRFDVGPLSPELTVALAESREAAPR